MAGTRRRTVRRRLNWTRLLLVLAVLAALGGLVELERSPELRLQRFVVRGGPPSLAALTGLRQGEPLWSLDLLSADRNLLRRAPYLGTAQITRQWPQAVAIAVGYRVAEAVVAGPGGRLYGVDATGRVLAPVAGPGSLPVLGGVPAGSVRSYHDLRGADVAAALRLVQELRRQRFKVAQVVAAAPLQVVLPSGTEVIWPPAGDVVRTLRELSAVQKALAARDASAASIDLTTLARPLVVLRK